MKKNTSRRSFIKKATLGSAALGSAPMIFASSYEQKFVLQRPYAHQLFSANDQINLGLIGVGIQGIYDTMSALEVAANLFATGCKNGSLGFSRAQTRFGMPPRGFVRSRR